MKQKKVIKMVVLGVACLEQRAAIEGGLKGHNVQFAESLQYAIGASKGADVVALHTDHEDNLTDFFDYGFKGKVVPLFMKKDKQGMNIRGKFTEAVPVRRLADVILEMFGQTQSSAA